MIRPTSLWILLMMNMYWINIWIDCLCKRVNLINRCSRRILSNYRRVFSSGISLVSLVSSVTLVSLVTLVYLVTLVTESTQSQQGVQQRGDQSPSEQLVNRTHEKPNGNHLWKYFLSNFDQPRGNERCLHTPPLPHNWKENQHLTLNCSCLSGNLLEITRKLFENLTFNCSHPSASLAW